MRITVLPSPLLGPATYRPLAAALADAGHETAVAKVSGRSVPEVLAAFAAQAAGGDVLVPHSNAGRFAGALGDSVAAEPVRTIYMDATLPEQPPGVGLERLLRTMADEDGVLPGWTDWWPTEEVDALLPGPWRTTVEAEQGRWPLDFLLRDPEPVVDWKARPSAFLGFGETYGSERRTAEALGWPVRVLDGTHLHHLHDPAGVAAAVDELLHRLA